MATIVKQKSGRWRAQVRRKGIRDRKDPRLKRGNHQNIPLLDASGYDAWLLIEEQA